jgi:hypothetical protein
MPVSSFWCLSGSESTARLAKWADDEVETERIICPINDGHQRGGKRLTDLSVVLPHKSVEDFVWTWYSECLLQDHVLELFRSCGFSGFHVNPAAARYNRASRQTPPKLWEFVVTGWAGVAPAISGIRLKERCEACKHTVYSGCTNANALIDFSQWDGSDFFIVWPMPRFIFVTDRVAQMIRENKLTGVALKAPGDLDISDGFSPGLLSYYMPEKRAAELGIASGIDW